MANDEGKMHIQKLILLSLLVCNGVLLPEPCLGPAKKSGGPKENPPRHSVRLTGFGERAVWSPDGERIAFVVKAFGDAFEIDFNAKLIRLLTGHFHHEGLLRIHCLPNDGDYFLIGAWKFTDIRVTRSRDQEMSVMKADAKTPPVPLHHTINEGVAASRTGMRIAWSNTHEQDPDHLMIGESVLYTAPLFPKKVFLH